MLETNEKQKTRDGPCRMTSVSMTATVHTGMTMGAQENPQRMSQTPQTRCTLPNVAVTTTTTHVAPLSVVQTHYNNTPAHQFRNPKNGPRNETNFRSRKGRQIGVPQLLGYTFLSLVFAPEDGFCFGTHGSAPLRHAVRTTKARQKQEPLDTNTNSYSHGSKKTTEGMRPGKHSLTPTCDPNPPPWIPWLNASHTALSPSTWFFPQPSVRPDILQGADTLVAPMIAIRTASRLRPNTNKDNA